jgi:outer membrane protein TolC
MPQVSKIKMKKSSHKFYLVIMLFLISTHSFGQVDTLQQLSLPQFMQMVKQFHPIAKQADLIPKSAEASTLAARGAFDPKLFYDFRNKFYDDKNYYSLGNGGFYIPTWFGLELKAGYERNQGNYLNPENSMPDQGLLYSQISLPLLQGLLIDERRATLKQAKLYVDLSEFDKINVLNELLYRAGKAYWDWYLAYANLKIHENAVVLSQTRFEAVRKTFVFGDRPAIDTVEANIQLQDRIINLQQALMEFRTKSLLLSTFLWIADDTPIELTNKTIPTDIVKDDERYFNLNVAAIDSLIESHPSLMVYDFKIKQLKIEERFKKDKLKPKLNINYNPLFSADNLNLTYQNNYKWGMSVAFPILLRKERGDLQLTRIKIENTQYENKGKRIELLNKTKASINEFSNYKIQIDIYTKNVSNYERLWQSERKLFDRGESSLFMINSREMSYINAQIKLNEIINKNKKAALETVYSFGKLSVNY